MKERNFLKGKLIILGFIVSVLMTLIFCVEEYIIFQEQIESFAGISIPVIVNCLILAGLVVVLRKKIHMNSRDTRITLLSANFFYMLLTLVVMTFIYIKHALNAGLEYLGIVVVFLISESISIIIGVILLIMMRIKRD